MGLNQPYGELSVPMQHPFDSEARFETVEPIIHPAIFLVCPTDKADEADEVARYVLYTYIGSVVADGTYECHRTASKIYWEAETDTRFFPADPQFETAEIAIARWR